MCFLFKQESAYELRMSGWSSDVCSSDLCGTSTGTAIGLSTLDDSGKWSGLEVDYCRAVAAALLGDAAKVRFVPLEFKNAFAALQSGSVDMLARAADRKSTRLNSSH